MTKEELRFLTKKYLEPVKHKMYWSRRPGTFVHKHTGKNIAGGSFTGTVGEWYETLVETIIDAGNVLKVGKNISISVSQDILVILESSILYKPLYLYDESGDILLDDLGKPFKHETLKSIMRGGIKVYLDNDQPRNKILVFSNDQEEFLELEILNMDIV